MRWKGLLIALCVALIIVPVTGAGASYMPGTGPYDVQEVVFPGYVFDDEVLNASSAVLLDINSGAALFAMNADEIYGPASLSKIVTLALAYDALEAGEVSPDDEVPISEDAWAVNVPGSNMFIEVDTEVPLHELMRGMIVASGNDACVAVAEYLAGSEDRFVDRMNDKVVEIGMTDTELRTVHGLHAEGQQITPRDVARLVRYFWSNYPEAEDITTEKTFSYGGIEQSNRNGLLFRDDRVTGLKTGYTDESGYHFVATARDGDEHYAAVVMGVGAGEDISEQEGTAQREADAERLLNWAFDTFTRVETDLSPAIPADMTVYKGEQREVQLTTAPQRLTVTVPEGSEDDIFLEASLADELIAPLSADDPVGYVEAFWRPGGAADDDDEEEDDGEDADDSIRLAEATVHPAADVQAGGWWRRMWDSILLFFSRLLD